MKRIKSADRKEIKVILVVSWTSNKWNWTIIKFHDMNFEF